MRAAILILLLVLVAAGCRTTEETIDPDTVFGHRFDHVDPDERTVLELEPPPPGTEYFTYPVYVSEVRTRTGERLPDGRVPVEILIFGALADVCTHLYRADERRMVQQLYLDFEMWRGKGASCPQVSRPFRFYHVMEQALAPGFYTLHVNDVAHPFEIFPPQPDA